MKKIKILETLKNRTNHFAGKFTMSELERCQQEGLQFMNGSFTAFRWRDHKVIVTDGYDAVHMDIDGTIGRRYLLPIYTGKIINALGLDNGLDSALETLNHKIENSKFELVTDDATYSMGQAFTMTTRNFVIDVNPLFGYVEVKRRNNDFEALLLPRSECPFNFYDLCAVLGNGIQEEKGDYKMFYSSSKKIVIFGNGDKLELDPEEF